MRFPRVRTGQTTSGSSTIEPSVIFQLVANRNDKQKKHRENMPETQGQDIPRMYSARVPRH